MDFLRNGAHRRTIVTLPSVLSRRIDTWQIVYLSYKDETLPCTVLEEEEDPCPTISINKSETKVH